MGQPAHDDVGQRSGRLSVPSGKTSDAVDEMEVEVCFRPESQKMVIVPAEMSALVGTIGGIGELVKAISSDTPTRPAPPPRARSGGAVPSTGA